MSESRINKKERFQSPSDLEHGLKRFTLGLDRAAAHWRDNVGVAAKSEAHLEISRQRLRAQ